MCGTCVGGAVSGYTVLVGVPALDRADAAAERARISRGSARRARETAVVESDQAVVARLLAMAREYDVAAEFQAGASAYQAALHERSKARVGYGVPGAPVHWSSWPVVRD